MSDTSDAPLPQTQSLRRSATLPSKLITRPRRQSESLRPSENDLFYHPSAKVVHFAPRALAPIPSSTAPSDFDYPVDTVETLPWRSPTERTVALGPLRLDSPPPRRFVSFPRPLIVCLGLWLPLLSFPVHYLGAFCMTAAAHRAGVQ
jgi:hypothetical protein